MAPHVDALLRSVVFLEERRNIFDAVAGPQAGDEDGAFGAEEWQRWRKRSFEKEAFRCVSMSFQGATRLATGSRVHTKADEEKAKEQAEWEKVFGLKSFAQELCSRA